MPTTSSTSVMQQALIGPIEPAVLFALLTDPDITPYFFNRCSFRCEHLEPGAPYALVSGERVMADGVILEYDPPNSIAMTFAQHWDEGINDPASRVRFSVTERSPLCKLTIVHDRLTAGSPLVDDVDDSWLTIASGLKTLVEAGRAMPLTDDEAKELAAAV